MYVRNCWYVAAWSYEVEGEAMVARTVAEEPILIYRLADGTLTALADQCPHRYLPLSMGRREGDDVRCMYHGIRFSSTGRCMEVPGQPFAPGRMAVRRYAAVEQGNWIWIWLGDAETADESLIPHTIGYDDPGYVLRYGAIDYVADYQLINDNLTDFSHLAFVHENTIGVGSKHAEKQPDVESLPRGVGIGRWHRDVPNSRPYVAAKTVDLYSAYQYLAPGIMFKVAAVFEPGAAQFFDEAEPDSRIEPLHANVSSQAVTPTTKGNSRYFFSVGPRRDEPNSEALADQMFELIQAAFEEDRVTIEAQQRSMLSRPPGSELLSILHDKGPILMRRAIERLIKAERAADSADAPAERVQDEAKAIAET